MKVKKRLQGLWKKFIQTQKEKKVTKVDVKTLRLINEYGENAQLDDDERLRRYLQEKNHTIDFKNTIGEKHCTIEIPLDLRHKTDTIIRFYRWKGHIVTELEKIDPINYGLLLLNWRDADALNNLIDSINKIREQKADKTENGDGQDCDK